MPKIVARVKRRFSKTECFFCVENKIPTYKQYAVLKEFLTSRGKILGKDRSGVCSKHQRRLSQAVKRARQMALL